MGLVSFLSDFLPLHLLFTPTDQLLHMVMLTRIYARRLPFLLQLVPGLVLGLGIFVLPFS